MKLPEKFGPELALLTERLTQSAGQLAKIGLPDIGASPHETVLVGEGFRLLRYNSGAVRENQSAVLIVYALVIPALLTRMLIGPRSVSIFATLWEH